MATLRLELLLSPIEQITIFNSSTEMEVNEFSDDQLQVFDNFIKLTGESFTLIDNVPGEDIVVYWNKHFTHNENYAIDPFYPRITIDYNSLTDIEKNTVDSFITFINSIS